MKFTNSFPKTERSLRPPRFLLLGKIHHSKYKILLILFLSFFVVGAQPAEISLAALRGDDQSVRRLIASGANVNSNKGFTPLIGAAQNGHTKIVRMLIEANADVNYALTINDPDSNGLTALAAASNNGHFEVVRELINARANVNARTSDGKTPLIVASLFGHQNVVKLLLEANANINIKAGPNQFSALIVASESGHLEVVRLLLSKNADLNAAMIDGNTSLILASKGGFDEILKILIVAGSNLNTKNNNKYSALTIAATHGHFNCVQTLLATNAFSKKEIAEATEFAQAKGHLKIAELLARHLQEPKSDLSIPTNQPTAPITTTGDAQTSEGLNIIKAVVREVKNEYGRGGMAGLMGKSIEHHRIATDKNDLASMIRFIAFDLQCHFLDKSFCESNKVDLNPYFTEAKMSERWVPIFKNVGLTDVHEMQKIIRHLSKLVQEETAKILSE